MKKKKFECDICDKSFDTFHGLEVHKSRMHGKKKKKKRKIKGIEVDLTGGSKIIGVPLLVKFRVELLGVDEGKV